MKKSNGISKKLSDECLVTIRKKAPPPLKLHLVAVLPLELNQGVVGVSTKSIHERILLKSDNLIKIYAKNSEKQCLLSVLGEEKE